jgi:thiol:disulfide interchange protein DsbC
MIIRHKIAVAAIVLVFILSIAGYSFAGEKAEEAALSKDEAAVLFKDLAPDLKILEVRPSPVKELWEIAVQSGERKGLLYLDSSKKYFIQGAIIDLKTKANLTQDRMSELTKVDPATIPLDDALVMGDKEAKYKVIVFTDPDCPYCEKLHQEIKKVVAKRQDIAFFIKMYPLPMHKGAYEKAKAIVCEKSMALLDDAFAKKPLPEAKCASTAVDDNLKLAEKLGIRGTPAIIMPNGIITPGSRDADALIELIEKSAK